MELLVFVIGCGIGVISGALGIGGGIVLAPLLLYLPPLFGFGALDMRAVSGLTMVQSIVTGLTGMALHRQARHVHGRLALIMGVTLAAAAFAGALASGLVSSHSLLALFAALAFAAGFLMLLPNAAADTETAASMVTFNSPLAVGLGAGVGFVGGMIGQSGAFLLNPALLWFLRIPTRVTIGTSLAIISCGAIAGTIGKVLAGQIALAPALALCAGAALGAVAGSSLSELLPTRALRLALSVLVLVAALKMTADFFRG